MPTRHCTRCSAEKPLAAFGMIRRPSRGDPDRVIARARCKECEAELRRLRYAADPQAGREAARRWRAGEPAAQRAVRARHSSWFRKYGITPEEYAGLLDQQHGVCAVCRRPETAVRQGAVLHLAVDHDHLDGHVRGLLCHRCNQALGHLDDSVELLKAMIYYLESGE